MAATLANSGLCPTTGKKILGENAVRDTLTLMHSCGMYDKAGEFSFAVSEGGGWREGEEWRERGGGGRERECCAVRGRGRDGGVSRCCYPSSGGSPSQVRCVWGDHGGGPQRDGDVSLQPARQPEWQQHEGPALLQGGWG